MADENDKKWRVLSSEYIIRRPWLTARRDKVMLPDGRINPEFYVLEYPAWVNILAVTVHGLYVLVRQYRHGIGRVGLELCAGVVEAGETPESGARRELAEETGYTGGEWSLQCVISGNPSTTNNLTYCYLAKGVELTGQQHLDATEDIDVILLTEDELYRKMIDGDIIQSLMLTPLWRYFALKNGCR